ncbi:hypothetical protein TNCV_1543981 [Trichonephila clavipes]|nr:hypothetical protein TNCV_1543981 [Trichonephila clavipes]
MVDSSSSNIPTPLAHADILREGHPRAAPLQVLHAVGIYTGHEWMQVARKDINSWYVMIESRRINGHISCQLHSPHTIVELPPTSTVRGRHEGAIDSWAFILIRMRPSTL